MTDIEESKHVDIVDDNDAKSDEQILEQPPLSKKVSFINIDTDTAKEYVEELPDQAVSIRSQRGSEQVSKIQPKKAYKPPLQLSDIDQKTVEFYMMRRQLLENQIEFMSLDDHSDFKKLMALGLVADKDLVMFPEAMGVLTVKERELFEKERLKV